MLMWMMWRRTVCMLARKMDNSIVYRWQDDKLAEGSCFAINQTDIVP
jgi:hypothetical protein